jgi:hypothetical protein
MKVSVTVRLEKEQVDLLAEAARATGQTVSDTVREALERALGPRTIHTRAGDLKGRLRLRQGDGWRQAIRDRNWRP